MDDAALQKLGGWLASALGRSVVIQSAAKLSGGAIQQNWLITGEIGGSPRELVLRQNAAATIGASHSRAHEFALIEVAHAAGILVPEPVAFCDDNTVLGSPFALMAKVEGVGFGPRIVKDMSIGGDRNRLAERLGRELAAIHAIVPGTPHIGAKLAFLGAAPASPGHAEIAYLRTALYALCASRPALEWGLRWAELNVPEAARVTLVHKDFRTGNYMVDAAGLTAILDWEFAGWGDPMGDIGWFCAACWRFGRSDLEAGGIGSRAAFYHGYREAGGDAINETSVHFWEIMAHVRWAVIALQQGERHASGREFSLEHALTGRIAAELELAVLEMTTPSARNLA
ncbi:MAG: phosphotransferase family protein [Bosea sp. (in: a-proteobacteria)]